MTATMPRVRPAAVPAPRPPAGRGDVRAPRSWRTPVIMTAAVLLGAAAAAPWLRVFGPSGLHLVVMAVPAAALAAAATRSCLRRLTRNPRSPWPPVAGFVVGLAAGALPGMLVAAQDPFSPAALAPRLREALTDGWYRLLSVPVPVPDTRTFTDLPFLITAALAAVIMLAALGRYPAAAVLPAALGFGGLLVLGVGGPVASTTLAGAFALVVLLFLASITPGTGYRTAVAAIVPGVALIAGTVLVVGAVHPGSPYNPRTTMRVPVDVTVSQDPLALLSARLETPATPVLTARLSSALLSSPPNWVVLSYDDYDGAGWLATGAAKPAVTGSQVPGTNGAGSALVTLAQQATLLPHPAYVLGTDGEDLGYDPDTEMLASPQAIRGYSVEVSVPEPTQAELTAAAVPAGVPAVLTQTPSCTPKVITQLAHEVRAAVGAPIDQLLRLKGVLSSAPFRYDKAAAPGQGCGSIVNMLASRKGTSAQFATAFVLAARLLGIPARVAVGYSPGTLSGDTETVTDADAHAWAQVDLTGVGWVDFDPTPNGGSGGQTPAREEQPALQKLQHKEPQSSPVGTPKLTPPAPVPPGMSAQARVLLAVVAAAALVLAWVTAIWLWSRRRRRRRRHAAQPAARVLGAWDEFLIPLAQAGTPIRGRSAPAVAADAAAVVPDEGHSVGQLAVLAERALYDEITDRDADVAWQLSDRARARAAAAASRSARLRRMFMPARITR
jgi:transglutaminase-like putative cysteine protease